MKVISLLQPWASLVVLGHKKIETRSWNTKHRGPLLIHASLGKKGLVLIDKQDPFGELATELVKLDMHHYDYPLSAIIGKVELDSTFQFIGDPAWISEQEKAFGDYSPMRWGWRLSNPIQFPVIIPAKGSLSIWNYDIPEKIGCNLITGGHASFEGMPSSKTVEALEEMVRKAK